MELEVAELAGRTPLDLGATDWVTVEQHFIDQFARATSDPRSINLDNHQVAGCGGAIAHGYLIVSLLPVLLAQLLVITDKVRGTNYGLNSVRFVSPVPVGAQVRLVAEILGAGARADGAVQYTVSALIEVRGADRPAMVAEAIYLAYPSAD